MMSRLEGKVAVVSGGNSGIGLAIAQRFVKEGAHVFIFGRRKGALDEAVKSIGGNVTAIEADASRLEDLDRVAGIVRKAKGKVDVVVSNAGFTEQVPLRDITEKHYDRTFNLMAKGPLFLVQKMLPMMAGGGSIILVSSAMHTMGGMPPPPPSRSGRERSGCSTKGLPLGPRQDSMSPRLRVASNLLPSPTAL